MNLYLPIDHTVRLTYGLLLGPYNSAQTVLVLRSAGSTNPQVSYFLAELASLDISGNNSDICSGLVANGHEVARLVDVKSAGISAVRRSKISPRKTSGGVNGVLSNGVLAIKLLVVSVGNVDVLVLDVDLANLGTGNGGGVALVWGQCLLEGQSQASSRGVGYSPSRDAVGQLIGDEENRVGSSLSDSGGFRRGLPEDAVAGSGSRNGLCRGAFRELSRILVNLVNTDEIGSKIRHNEEISSWVHKGVVGMSSLLSVRVDTLANVLDCLQWLLAVQWQLESRQLGSLAVWRLAAADMWRAC